MARQTKETNSLYECVQTCTVWVEVGGETVEKLYHPYDEEGGVEHEELWQLRVPRGTVVCKHFMPYNEFAEEDRDDQMENPSKYIRDDKDMSLLGEIMVKRGYFKDEFGVNEKGKRVLKRTGVEIAVEAIKEQLGDDAVIHETEDMKRSRTIAELCIVGKDIKETRQKLNKMLKEGGVTGYFKGSAPEALAALVMDNGLYTGS